MRASAPRRRLPGFAQLTAWLNHHRQTARDSLGRLLRQRLPSFMTAAVIGIALALPGGLYLLLENLHSVAERWDGAATLSVFLRPDVPDVQTRALADEIGAWPEVETVEVIGRAEALEEFRRLSGFGDALDALDENPLPAVLVLRPAADDPVALTALVQRLGGLPQTDFAQIDLQWVQRFTAMVDIARRAVLVMGALLALAVLLIVGNTIRLEILNRREEIEVTKLIGATDVFIRRPFLYSGLWYGLAGSLMAWLLVALAFWQLHAPVRRLAALYQSDFTLRFLSATDAAVLLAAGAILGLLGAWLAVGRHLHAIEPQ